MENRIAEYQEEGVTVESRSGQELPSAGKERRRNRRLILTVPVSVEWAEPGGPIVKGQASAKDVDVRGASLQMVEGRTVPGLNVEISLENKLTGEAVRARVKRIKRSGNGKLERIGIELLEPTEKFWGLTFQLQQTMIQLLEIENAFQERAQEDFRVLRNLREGVEYLHGVTSAVQQWQELREQGKDGYSVLEVLGRGRVDRATRLLQDLTADIDAFELTSDTKDFSSLAQAVERLYERMTRGPVGSGRS